MVKTIASNKEIDSISQFCNKRLNGLLDKTADTNPIFMQTNYDIVKWIKNNEGKKLSSFYTKDSPKDYKFYYTENQLKVRSDHFRRYGTDINALSKIVTRVSNIELLTRRISGNEEELEIFSDSDQNRFTKYALSN